MRLRSAAIADCADLAILDDIAGHGLPSVLWREAVDAGQARNAWEFAREQFLDDKAGSSWRDAVVAEVDGEIAGSAIGYCLPINTEFDTSPNSIVAPILALFKRAAGSWLIDSLAVYRNWQGKGIAQSLLKDQIDKASEKDVYLVAADDNIPALNLYENHDFHKVAQEHCVPFSSNINTKYWLLMRRNHAERG